MSRRDFIAPSAEQLYRALPIISYSSLKDYENDILKFYKVHILRQKEKESSRDDIESKALILGDVLDGLCTLSEEDFDRKFETILTEKKGGQLWEMGDILWELYKSALVEDSEGNYQMSKDFSYILEQAFETTRKNSKGEIIQFKGKSFEDVVNLWADSDAEVLFKERVSKCNKKIISQSIRQEAEKIKETLYNTPWTRKILAAESDENLTVIKQHQVVYQVEGVDVKLMLDVVHIDHKTKKIKPYDLKCSWMVQHFGTQYKKLKYYLQGSNYYFGLMDWRDKNGYETYDVEPMRFIVADSTNQMKPIIWETDMTNVWEGWHGFVDKYSGVYHRGILSLIKDLKWHLELMETLDNPIDAFRMSKKAFDNNGIMQIQNLGIEE